MVRWKNCFFAEMLFNLISFIKLGVVSSDKKTNLSSLRRIVGTGFLISLLFECFTVYFSNRYNKYNGFDFKYARCLCEAYDLQIFIRVCSKSQTENGSIS